MAENKSGITITVREWERLPLERVNVTQMPERDFLRLMRDVVSRTVKFTRVMEYDPLNQKIRFINNWVGVLTLPGDVTVEILPKLGSEGEARQLLLDMSIIYFRFMKILPLHLSSAAEKTAQSPLDLLIALFLEQTAILVRRGLAREYHDYREPGHFIRGGIDFARQSSRYIDIPVHLKYQEFEENRPENRLVKSALIKAARLTGDVRKKLFARKILLHFESVQTSTHIQKDFDSWKRKGGRNLAHYKAVKPLAELILNEQSPSPVHSNSNMPFSLLFSMDRLFEVYLEHHLRKTSLVVKPQKSSESYLSYQGEPFFTLKPDFLLSGKGKPSTVADAKWKLISQKDMVRDNYYGLDRADLYQLFTYIRYYAKETNQACLIYPRTEDFYEPRYFNYLHDGEKITMIPFDCLRPEESAEMINEYIKKCGNIDVSVHVGKA